MSRKLLALLSIFSILASPAYGATTTPNMSLSVPAAGDTDYPTSISDSFTLIDEHDHSTGNGVQIPSGGIANGAITVNKPASSSADGSTIEVSSGAYRVKDGGITAAKLASGLGVVPAGAVQYYLGSSAPSGYLLGQGQEVSRTTYADLFAVVGTAFGSGDGSTTFNLPDCRGMFIRGHVGFGSPTFAAGDVNTGTDVITVSGGHGFNRSGFPFRVSSSGSLPTGLTAGTTYYAIYVSSTTFKVASSEANALTGTAIDITAAGSGTNTLAQYIDIDASSRTAPSTGGNTGTNLGAKQDAAYASHNHGVTDPGHTHNIEFEDGGGAQVRPLAGTTASPPNVWSGSIMSATTGISINNNGGNETRPQNLTMNCIVKY